MSRRIAVFADSEFLARVAARALVLQPGDRVQHGMVGDRPSGRYDLIMVEVDSGRSRDQEFWTWVNEQCSPRLTDDGVVLINQVGVS